jgi:hypothetical protein
MANKSIAPHKWEWVKSFFDGIGLDVSGLVGKLGFKTSSPQTYSAGQLSYDPTTKTGMFDTGFAGVRVNIGQETHVRFFNDTGSTITNGTVVNTGGIDATNDVVKGIPIDITNPALSSSVLGVATADVLNGEVGVATKLGDVRGLDTSLLSEGGVLYAGVGGGLTQTFQNYPNRVVIIGTVVKSDPTDGIIFVDASIFTRGTGSKSYSFTQANVGSGVYYSGGFYDAAGIDATLTQSALTAPFGTANAPYAAHAFAVFAGGGTVDTGVVGLRVRGVSIDDDGVQVADDTQIITEDITAPVLNDYLETAKKWLGAIQFELYTVSGTPTAYSVTFNYGLAKYEDLNNKDFTVTGVEVVGTAGANDALFDIELLHHKPTGWTYAATGFVAGNGNIATWAGDMAPYDNLANGESFAWKRTDLNTFVDGDGPEGIMFRISANQNNSVQSMDIHLAGVIEELVF